MSTVADYLNTSREAAGLLIREGFYGNHSITSSGQTFTTAAQSASVFSGIGNKAKNADISNGMISKNVLGINNDIYITDADVAELQKVAVDISKLGRIPYQAAEDFLYILITIDSIEVMKKIAATTGIAELAEERVINSPGEIFAIPGLSKLAYLADAIFAIVKAYEKFHNIQNTDNKPASNSLSDIMASVNSVLGIVSSVGGANATAGAGGLVLGNVLSKMLLGKEVPMGVQTNNPSLLAPSMAAMMMFGQSPGAAHNTDMNQTFAAPIAIFGDMVGASGMSSFQVKNVGSLSQPQSLGSFISQKMFGGTPTNSFQSASLSLVQSSVGSVLGANSSSMVDMTAADNAVPIMAAMANAFTSIPQQQPVIDKEYRKKATTITQTQSGITEAFTKGANIDAITKAGVTNTSPTSVLSSINTSVTSVFPVMLFQEGWKTSCAVQQEASKDDVFYQKLLFILNSLV